jgi:hypothetical protein
VGQVSGTPLSPAARPSDKAPMHADRGAAALETIHEPLRDLIAGLMASTTQRSKPSAHVSFLALGGGNAQAFELVQVLNAVFGIDLPSDAVLTSPTPDALARSVEIAWSEGEGTAEELAERLAALTDDD